MQALRSGPGASPDHPHLQPRQISQRSSEGIYSSGQEESIPPFDAQLASLFAAGPKGTNTSVAQGQKPKTLLQKLVPVTHMLAMWCLLSWCVIWGGGKYSYVQEGSTKRHFWERLGDLSRRPPSFMEQDTGVVRIIFLSWPNLMLLLQNIFWGFATFQLVLHSIRLFSGFVRNFIDCFMKKLLMVHAGHVATSSIADNCASTSPTAALNSCCKWAEIFADGIHVIG